MAEQREQYTNPKYYLNRELSWLQFDRRCLSEARNKDNPLFERLKFLSITASNLDEFFMVRIASLQDMVNAGYKKRDIAGMTAREQLDAIIEDTHNFMQSQYWTYNHQLLPGLRENGLDVVESYNKLTPEEKSFVDEYFVTEVFPVLTPMAVDNSRPFPLVSNKSLNICALLTRQEGTGQGIPGYLQKPKKPAKESKETKALKAARHAGELKAVLDEVKEAKAAKEAAKAAKEKDPNAPKAVKEGKEGKGGKSKEAKAGREKESFQYATVQVPAVLPRILELPESENRRVIFLEEIIRHHLDSLFLNYDVVCAYPYRVTRNADLTIDEDDASDLLKEIEKQLKKRQRGYAIRLEVEHGMDPRLLDFLKKEFSVTPEKIFEIDGPLDLTFLMKLYGLDGFEWLREDRYARPQEIPRLPAGFSFPSPDSRAERRRRIPRFWPSSRPSIVSAAIHRSSRPLQKPRRTENRSLSWLNSRPASTRKTILSGRVCSSMPAAMSFTVLPASRPTVRSLSWCAAKTTASAATSIWLPATTTIRRPRSIRISA